MTKRERMEARLEKRRAWAESREKKADQSYERAHDLVKDIPFGQPVLVGHHSEKRHRGVLAKADAAGFKGVEHSKMAEHHASKADGIERQLEKTIFSDDPNAIEALTAKADEIDRYRERCKALNAIFKKTGGATSEEKLKRMMVDGTITAEEAAEALRNLTYSWEKTKLFPAYHLANQGANARRIRERIKELEVRGEFLKKVAAAGGVLIQRYPDKNWCRVTFEEKPSREILGGLRSAGYRWGGIFWQGPLNALPEIVTAEEKEGGGAE